MIVLRAAPGAQTSEWIETLKDLSLAHKLDLNEGFEKPQLSHSGKDYDGPDAIRSYLDQLYAERELWWYCTCDRKT